SWFVSIDGKYKIDDSLSDYITVNYGNESENAIDGGSSYRFLGGDFSNAVIGITDRFSITGTRLAHNIEIGFEINDVKGKWYDQKHTTQNGTTVWEVMNSSIKHKESLTTAHGAYRFDILDNNGVSSLTAGIGVGYITSDTKNYPEVYFRKYSNLGIKANVTKYFNIKKVRLGVGVDGGYDMNLSSSCDFNGIDIENEYSLPMYYFLTSSAYNVNGKIEGKLPVGKVILGAFVSGGTMRCADAKEMFKNTSLNNFKCGLNLSF
ncbi:MAG: hypothetical protein K2N08_05705, partial [Muribaculaceae bacterium]|nr:hypothetical protein [Muribaculaceae bacterium]